MTNNSQLTNEELTQIRERTEKVAEGNPLKIGFNGEVFELYDVDGEWIADAGVSDVAQFISDAYEDIPKLLAEIEVLRNQNESLIRFLHAEGYVPDDDEINWEDVE